MKNIWQLRNLGLVTVSAIAGLELLNHSNALAATLWNTLTPSSAQAFSSQSDGSIPSEAADDFFFLESFSPRFQVEKIKVNGLLSDPTADITDVTVELYQSFPLDSSSTRIPQTVRENGPADNEFARFNSEEGSLSFEVSDKGSFTVANTITPAETLGAVGPGLTGNLREISIALTEPVVLSAAASSTDQQNHFFLAATIGTSSGEYYWVTGQQPPVVMGDRQAWLRTDSFAPDWIRVSDVINNTPGTLTPAFNASFKITGTPKPVPEPSSGLGTLALGSVGLTLVVLRQRRSQIRS